MEESFWGKIKRRWFLVLSLSVLLIVLVFLSLVIYNRYFKKEGSKTIRIIDLLTSQKEGGKKATSLLDGTQAAEETANLHPLAIMIENHTEARPQYGLSKASIIYEALAEGGITRFMAVFGPYGADKVGPVRSARTYYVDWALEYDAFYAHAGGAQNALEKIAKEGVKALPHDKFAYWREPEPGKASEHTLFASVPKLYQVAEKKKYSLERGDWRPWKFKNPTPPTGGGGKGITINFSSPQFAVEWNYDSTSNKYLRVMAGAPHKDAGNGEQIKAANIVVQYVARRIVDSGGGKQVWQMETVGSGKAKVLLDGKIIEGTWKKAKPRERTLFYDENAKEIEFNPGQTWIEVVGDDIGVTEK